MITRYLNRDEIISSLIFPPKILIYGRVYKDCLGIYDLYNARTYKTNSTPNKYNIQGWAELKEYSNGYYNIHWFKIHPIYIVRYMSLNSIGFREIRYDSKNYRNIYINHPIVRYENVIGNIIPEDFTGIIYDIDGDADIKERIFNKIRDKNFKC